MKALQHLFCVVGVCACLPQASADTVVVQGAHGQNGAPGVNDTTYVNYNGGHGGAGLSANASATGPLAEATATGGQGGYGGDGAPSVGSRPWTNLGDRPWGGRGGTAGPGGAATATAISDRLQEGGDAKANAVATGGASGAWGFPGPSDPEWTPSQIGNSNAGGDATAKAEAHTTAGRADATAHAAAGYGNPAGTAQATAQASNTSVDPVTINAFARGGSGFHPTTGLNGQPATLGIVRGVSTGGGRVDVMGQVQGGSGGWATHGGHGANATLTDALSGSTTGALFLDQGAYGGEGGTAYGQEALPGNGGTGFSSFTYTDTTASDLTLTSSASGGPGGNGVEHSGAAGTGTAHLQATGAGNVTGTVHAAAGGGGGRNVGAGAPGGVATVSPSSAVSTGIGKTVKLSASQVGGTGGGGGSGTGAGGAGANSSMTNLISGSAPGGTLTLAQTAMGGHGGGGGSNMAGGHGGFAHSELTVDQDAEAKLDIQVSARGGSGGRGNYTAGALAAGGDATAIGSAKGKGDVALTVEGNGGGGSSGGSATATGTAHSTGAGAVVLQTSAWAEPRGSATVSAQGRSATGPVSVHGNAYGPQMTLANVVSGQTAGHLTLQQHAYSIGTSGPDADASSTLIMPGGNPGGGALTGHAIASSANGNATAVSNLTNHGDVNASAGTSHTTGVAQATATAVCTKARCGAFASAQGKGSSGSKTATSESFGGVCYKMRASATLPGESAYGPSVNCAPEGSGTGSGGTVSIVGGPVPSGFGGGNIGAATAGMDVLADIAFGGRFTSATAQVGISSDYYKEDLVMGFVKGGLNDAGNSVTSVNLNITTTTGRTVFNETFTNWTTLQTRLTDHVIQLGTGGLAETYIIKFTVAGATDDVFFDSRIIIATRAHPAFQWIRGRGLSADDADFGADPDHDGIPNLMEWATNSNPTNQDQPATSFTRPATPGASLEYHYTRSIAAVAAGTSFAVEWSDTLGATDWHTTGVTQQVVNDDGDVQQVKALAPLAPGSTKRFIRLKVTPGTPPAP